MDELKACPNPECRSTNIVECEEAGLYWFECGSCGTEIFDPEEGWDRATAVEMWNGGWTFNDPAWNRCGGDEG